MPPRAVPALLALSAFVADLSGAHRFALVVLFVAIPAAFALVATSYADARGTPTLAATAGLILLVVSAALRSPAVVGGVPRIAITAVALAPLACLYPALRVVRARRPARIEVAVEEREELAA